MQTTMSAWLAVLPLWVLWGAIVLLIVGMLWKWRPGVVWWCGGVALLFCLVWVGVRSTAGEFFPGSDAQSLLYWEDRTWLIHVLILGLGLLVWLMLSGKEERYRGHDALEKSMLLLSISGLLVCAAAGDVLSLWMGLELAVVPALVMSGAWTMDRRSMSAVGWGFRGQMAGTGLLLLGGAMIYGGTDGFYGTLLPVRRINVMVPHLLWFGSVLLGLGVAGKGLVALTMGRWYRREGRGLSHAVLLWWISVGAVCGLVCVESWQKSMTLYKQGLPQDAMLRQSRMLGSPRQKARQRSLLSVPLKRKRMQKERDVATTRPRDLLKPSASQPIPRATSLPTSTNSRSVKRPTSQPIMRGASSVPSTPALTRPSTQPVLRLPATK